MFSSPALPSSAATITRKPFAICAVHDNQSRNLPANHANHTNFGKSDFENFRRSIRVYSRLPRRSASAKVGDSRAEILRFVHDDNAE
jgi:hypothetical protein